jgi:hypothetical protein
MNKTTWTRHLTVAATVVLTGGILWPATAVAGPAQSAEMEVAALAAAPMRPAGPCIVRDGTATSGVKVGSNPPRYEYGNSPYLGVRYDSCADVFKIHYGGYTGITHYNLRINLGQRELRPREAGVLTMTPIFVPSSSTFAVQACKRGGLFERSSCTRWSPTVTISKR